MRDELVRSGQFFFSLEETNNAGRTCEERSIFIAYICMETVPMVYHGGTLESEAKQIMANASSKYFNR